MKKTTILLFNLFISGAAFSQVGIGTQTPAATLDITAKNPTGTTGSAEGILIPRIDRERAQSMTSVETSTIIYVNDISTGTQSGAAANIDAVGFYYYVGSAWAKLMGSGSVTASNGLTLSGSDVRLGGTLTQNTNIAAAGYNLTLNGGGKLGIGTTSPTANLQIIGSSGSGATLQYNGSSATTFPEITLGRGGASKGFASIAGLDGGSYGGGLSLNVKSATGSDNWPTGLQQALVIKHDGNVGIATTSPNATLDVTAKNATGTGSDPEGILIPRVDRQRAQSMTGTGTSTIIYVNNISTGTLSGTAANIDAVGFYYYNGSAWAKLNPPDTDTNIYLNDGTLSANRTVTMSDKTLNFNSSAISGTSHFAVDGTTLSVDAVNDRVGIGTTSPATKLDIVGQAARITNSGAASYYEASNGTSQLRLQNNNGAGFVGMITNHDLDVFTNNTSRIKVLAGGNVGIATTTPTAPLQIGDSKFRFYPAGTGSKTDPILMLGNNSNWQRITTGASASIGFWANGNGSTDDAAQMMLSSAGNLGIGTTSPGTKLDIVGQAARITNSGATSYYEASNGTSQLRLQNNNGAGIVGMITNHDLDIYTNNSSRIKVLAAGNVGIGTTSPSTLLHVNGIITATRIQGPSDSRFKTNVKPIEGALDKVTKLNGYTYDWKEASQFPGQTLGKGHDMGVIAQEVEKLFPEAVSTNAEGYKAVSYTTLIPVLIEALKEQQQQINELKKHVYQAHRSPSSHTK